MIYGLMGLTTIGGVATIIYATLAMVRNETAIAKSVVRMNDQLANKYAAEAQLALSQQHQVDGQAAITWAQAHLWEAAATVGVPMIFLLGGIALVGLGVAGLYLLNQYQQQKLQLALATQAAQQAAMSGRSKPAFTAPQPTTIINGQARTPVRVYRRDKPMLTGDDVRRLTGPKN